METEKLVEDLQRSSYLVQVLHRERNVEHLTRLSERLQDAFDSLTVSG